MPDPIPDDPRKPEDGQEPIDPPVEDPQEDDEEENEEED